MPVSPVPRIHSYVISYYFVTKKKGKEGEKKKKKRKREKKKSKESQR